MTDRELLELAANAYWGDEIDDVCSIRWIDAEQAIGYIHADNQDHNCIDRELLWNPLEDDGDALRLAVKMKLDLCRRYANDSCIYVWLDHDNDFIEEPLGADHYSATRRIIVRAAAEIGRNAQ